MTQHPFRSIASSEIPVVADLQARSFLDDYDRYLESYAGGGRVDHRALRLYENQAGQPVAALNVFNRAMSLGGGELEAALVASVSVPPEWRRRGYARRMMAALLEELYGQQTPLSLLFPFSAGWYRGLGYGLVAFTWMLNLAPRLLPDFPERMNVRRVTSEDRDEIRGCYQQARRLPRNNGWLARTDWEWQHRVWKPGHQAVAYRGEDGVEGYLVFTLEYGAEGVVCEVLEWIWTSGAAWRGLAGFLASQGDQAGSVRYNAPQGDPLLPALPEPYDRRGRSEKFVFFPAAKLLSGYMARVIHLPSALAQRCYPAGLRADFVLEVADAQLPANGRPLRVAIRAGRAEVAAVDRTPSAVARTDMATFSQLFAGVVSPEQARTAGSLQAGDEVCAALQAAFAAAPWHMWQADWF